LEFVGKLIVYWVVVFVVLQSTDWIDCFQRQWKETSHSVLHRLRQPRERVICRSAWASRSVMGMYLQIVFVCQ